MEWVEIIYYPHFGGKWMGGFVVNGAGRNNILSPRISEHTKRAF